jgi:hypothetical protein
MTFQAKAASECAPTQLLGWWRLLSCDVEFQDSGVREPMYGVPAHGYIVFGPEGRMMTVVAAAQPQTQRTQDERAAPLHSMAAYAGSYRIEAERWVTSVDVAWSADWTGTEQERSFRIESDRLHVVSPRYSSPLHDGRVVRACLVWTRDLANVNLPGSQNIDSTPPQAA